MNTQRNGKPIGKSYETMFINYCKVTADVGEVTAFRLLPELLERGVGG